MATDDILKIVALILASCGGGAVVVVGLASWLGNLWAGRILQTERGRLDTQLEALRHELGITKSAYEHHLDLILDYYATFYRHYRLCQRTARGETTAVFGFGSCTAPLNTAIDVGFHCVQPNLHF